MSEQRNDSLSPNDPLSPTLKLAGEVEGLRPQAVTDKPIEPKLFVVHRNGDAVEIVRVNSYAIELECLYIRQISSQDFEEKQRFCEACPDASFESTDMIGPPCDLGGGRLHCFRHRR